MEELHQHNDLEVNFLVSGRVGYLFRGGLFDLPARQLVVFWGSTPHRIVDVEGEPDLITAQVPAAWIMDWDLPHAFVEGFLAGRFITERNASREALDEMLMDSWASDFETRPVDSLDPFKTIIYEIRARVQRLALSGVEDLRLAKVGPYSESTSWRRVEQIAHFMAENFRGLRPNYVMHLFKERCGVSVLSYLNSFRLAHAQHLLAVTDATVLDIALESGFGSLSRFYAVFKESCEMSPARYRKAFRR
jgi:AraC-like DNA-binding protein